MWLRIITVYIGRQLARHMFRWVPVLKTNKYNESVGSYNHCVNIHNECVPITVGECGTTSVDVDFQRHGRFKGEVILSGLCVRFEGFNHIRYVSKGNQG